ncbi:MAG: hypothetical protein HRT91_04115 [Piscirickettsiaceae bacterium]|nr:hypothetical protein [Piscirickettsiaceae bacterium]
MNNNKKLFSLEDFLNAYNKFDPTNNLGSTDYIYALFKLSNLPIDLTLCYIKLLTPKFRVVDGLIFLDETFNIHTYNEYPSKGLSKNEIQYWINIPAITDILEKTKE